MKRKSINVEALMKDPSGARLWNLPMRLQSDAPQVPLKTSAIRLIAHARHIGYSLIRTAAGKPEDMTEKESSKIKDMQLTLYLRLAEIHIRKKDNQMCKLMFDVAVEHVTELTTTKKVAELGLLCFSASRQCLQNGCREDALKWWTSSFSKFEDKTLAVGIAIPSEIRPIYFSKTAPKEKKTELKQSGWRMQYRRSRNIYEAQLDESGFVAEQRTI
ncbi:hypothetical protein Unana1_02149 [Umbelopsis nana]